MKDLKPCAHCGSPVDYWESKSMLGTTLYAIECSCGVKTIHKNNKKELIEIWNKRIVQQFCSHPNPAIEHIGERNI
jgi:Lar family restriction alleviation protein